MVPSGIINFDQGMVTVNANYLYSDGKYVPGTYTVEVRALTEKDVDTEAYEELTVIIVDPCVTATLIINETIFKSDP